MAARKLVGLADMMVFYQSDGPGAPRLRVRCRVCRVVVFETSAPMVTVERLNEAYGAHITNDH